MRNTRALAAGLTALAVVVAAAACGDSDTDTTATSPNTTTTTTTSVVEGSAEHNQADVMFARMMIPHHAQAIEMSDMILAKPEIPAEVTALAEQIKAAQGPEIAQLESWLADWDEPQMPTDVPGSGHMSDMPHMDGMMSDEDMQALADAQGVEAARLFLTQMIDHHEGAIDMAETEIEDGRFPDAVALARTIAETQQQEIDTMRRLLENL